MPDSAWMLLRGICRGLHLAGYFSAFGTLFFGAVLERADGQRRLAWAGGLLALLAGAGWFWLQSANFAGAYDAASVWSALPMVAGYTRFGWLLLARLGLLLAALLLAQARLWKPAALLAGLGVLAESWLGHGAAMSGQEGWLLFAVSLLHVGAAAVWLGTLPALYASLRHSWDPESLARRYSQLGMGCVALILTSAFVQYLLLIGSVQAFFTSAYGAASLAKLVLFAALLALAARNRYRLTPALPASLPALRQAIALETIIGLVLLVAAGILMQLEPPGMAGMG